MSIDQTMHSLFGASKVAADVLVQEYGRYFGLRTACFRGGCLTGPNHSGTQLHGFLSYLMKCAVTGTPYTVFGYKGKQVRDNIHSADLIAAFRDSSCTRASGEVYNIGGGRFSNCSMLEAIAICEEISGRELNWTYNEATAPATTSGGSATRQVPRHYPGWRPRYDVPAHPRGDPGRESSFAREHAETRSFCSVTRRIHRSRAPRNTPKRYWPPICVASWQAEHPRSSRSAPSIMKPPLAVMAAAENRERLTVSALAVHGVMTGVLDPAQQFRLNHLDLVVPDGQPCGGH